MHFHDSKVKIVHIYIYIHIYTYSVLLSFLLLAFLFPCPLQLTFEPHWLKLQRFTYIQIFFSSEYYSTMLHDHCWVNLQISQNQGYKKP